MFLRAHPRDIHPQYDTPQKDPLKDPLKACDEAMIDLRR